MQGTLGVQVSKRVSRYASRDEDLHRFVSIYFQPFVGKIMFYFDVNAFLK